MAPAQIARERGQPEVLPERLQACAISPLAPHDELLHRRRVFAPLDVASLPAGVGSFVVYQQGLKQLRLRRERWHQAFHRLEPKSDERCARGSSRDGGVKKRADVTEKVGPRPGRSRQEPALAASCAMRRTLAIARLEFERKKFPRRSPPRAHRAEELGGRPRLAVLRKAWTRYQSAR